MERSTSPTTLMLLRVMNKKPVSVLIDIGSMHTFVDPRAMQRIGSSIIPEPIFKVTVAGGGKLCSQGVCKGVKIKCQGVELTTDLHLLPIGGYQIVLGVDWLLTLDEMFLNYKDQIVRISKGGRAWTLKGVQSKSMQIVE